MVNPLRHLEVFSPAQFGDTRVDVIGCGATGSHIALGLAKLGIQNLHIWDFDTVEDHNLANQLYRMSDIGSPKVQALESVIKEQTGLTPSVHFTKLEGGHKDLGAIVFLLVDSMAARREIAEECLFMNLKTRLMIETRMGADAGFIYSIDMMNGMDYKEWVNTLHDDENTETTACGSPITVGATAMMVASYSIWQMLEWIRVGTVESNMVAFSSRPPSVIAQKFWE